MKLLLHNDPRPSEYLKSNYDYDLIKFVARRRGCSELNAFMRLARVPVRRAACIPAIAGGSGTMSNYTETHVIDHSNGKTAWTMPAVVALALTTTVPDSSKTGATIVEANYTGYGRITVAAATFNAATAGGAGAASTTATNAALTAANCTAGSSVVVGWALCDNATTAAGNMLWWGSATSTTISTTQTPATIASGGLTESLV